MNRPQNIIRGLMKGMEGRKDGRKREKGGRETDDN